MRQTQKISGFVHSQAYVKAIACLVLACGSTLPTLAASVTSASKEQTRDGIYISLAMYKA
jgi:hypothetical protein